MLKKNIVIASIALALTGFSGCAMTTGTPNYDNITQTNLKKSIIKGKTTKADIIKMFGQPKMKSVLGDTELWTYTFAPESNVLKEFIIPTVHTEAKTLSLWFDKNGVVTNFAFSENH